jgi:hypothetical protein
MFDKDRQLTARSVSVRRAGKSALGFSFIPMEVGEMQIIGIQYSTSSVRICPRRFAII